MQKKPKNKEGLFIIKSYELGLALALEMLQVLTNFGSKQTQSLKKQVKFKDLNKNFQVIVNVSAKFSEQRKVWL